MSTDVKQIVSQLSSLSILDVAELVKALESEWGVSAAAPTAAAPTAAAPTAVEQTEFTLFLAAIGDKKINVIKEVRAITSLGLAEAKKLVESAPTIVKENMSKEDVSKAEALLKGIGATVEVK
ncbi:MAG: 50S ribosomal protein L7/L12 [Alphaproteobacteria bacterium]|nr:50S ribosomal protein L7/L12 [Rickettsiales bacterium]